jgi:hypothetical protein
MASTNGHVLDSKQIHEQLHDDSDSFSEISQDSDIDIIVHSDHDAEINDPDLSDSGGSSDDGKASTNVDDDDEDGDGGGGGGDDNDDDDTNDDWAVWDKNDHDFCKIPFRASLGYKPPRNGQMPVSPCEFFRLFFSATLFDEIAAEPDRYVSEKINKPFLWKNIQFGLGGKTSQPKS